MAPKEHAGDEKEKKHVNPKEQALLADAARRELAALTMIEAAIVTWLAADAGRNLKIKAEAEVAEAKLKVEKEETQTRSVIALEKTATAAADESREKVVSSKAAAIAAREYAYEIAHSTDEAAALLQEAKADIKKSMLEVTIAEKALANAVERLRASSTDFKWAKRELERAEGLAADSKLAENAAAGAQRRCFDSPFRAGRVAGEGGGSATKRIPPTPNIPPRVPRCPTRSLVCRSLRVVANPSIESQAPS